MSMQKAMKRGRPKLIEAGKKITLYLPEKARQALFRLATERKMSMSGVASDLAIEADKILTGLAKSPR